MLNNNNNNSNNTSSTSSLSCQSSCGKSQTPPPLTQIHQPHCLNMCSPSKESNKTKTTPLSTTANYLQWAWTIAEQCSQVNGSRLTKRSLRTDSTNSHDDHLEKNKFDNDAFFFVLQMLNSYKNGDYVVKNGTDKNERYQSAQETCSEISNQVECVDFSNQSKKLNDVLNINSNRDKILNLLISQCILDQFNCHIFNAKQSTNLLKSWLNKHRSNPYPNKNEKIMLALITHMSLTQISTWFANARRRLKKENQMTWIPKNRNVVPSSGCNVESGKVEKKTNNAVSIKNNSLFANMENNNNDNDNDDNDDDDDDDNISNNVVVVDYEQSSNVHSKNHNYLNNSSFKSHCLLGNMYAKYKNCFTIFQNYLEQREVYSADDDNSSLEPGNKEELVCKKRKVNDENGTISWNNENTVDLISSDCISSKHSNKCLKIWSISDVLNNQETFK